MAKNTIIEDIASTINEDFAVEEPDTYEGSVPEVAQFGDTDGEDDLTAFIPKTHLPDGTAETEGETETPIVPPGETNAAPPSPGTLAPSGVLKMDAPFLIKMLEHAKAGGDIHQMASHVASTCGDPACSHMTMDHFDELASKAPAAEVQGSMDMTPADFAGAMPSEGDDIEGEVEIPVDGEAEVVEGETPGGDPVDEANKPPKEEEVEEVEVEKPTEEDEEDEDDDKPFEEAATPLADPLIEKFQPPVRQKASDNKSDPVPDGKPDFLKKKKDGEEDEDESIAESMTRLVNSMSTKSKLVFKGTQESNVAEFNIQPNPKMNSVLAESLTKALGNKDWLTKNKLDSLSKFKQVSIVNTAAMGKRHLIVLD